MAKQEFAKWAGRAIVALGVFWLTAQFKRSPVTILLFGLLGEVAHERFDRPISNVVYQAIR